MWCEITKDGKAKFIERYKDPMTGKQKRMSITLDRDTAKARKEAQKILSARIDAACQEDITQFTLEQVKAAYIQEQSTQLKVGTWKRNERSLNSSISMIGKDVLIGQLTAGYIRSKLLESGEPNTKLNNYLVRFKAMVRWAYQNDYLNSTQCIDKLKPFKEDESRKLKLQEKFLERDELAQLIEAMTEDYWRDVTKVLALSGMRIGELIALTSKDVDFKSHTINICKSYDSVNDVLANGAKTASSNRILYMQPELEEAVRDLRADQKLQSLATGARSFLFLHDENGGYIHYYSYNKYLKENSLKVLGRAITPHALRHTHVALLAENGIPLEEISARLGHSDSSITRDIYFHVTKKLEEQRRERLRRIQIL